MKTLFLTPDCDLQNQINYSDAQIIRLAKGEYKQKVEILRDGVIIVGEGADTKITFDDYANKLHADGKEYNTFRTYTLCVTANNVVIKNLTIENSTPDPATMGQCVALSVHGNNFFGKHLNLISTQDTLFLSPFPDDLVIRYKDFIPDSQLYREGTNFHVFKNCKISGTVDFIFGCARAFFIDCQIVSLKDSRKVGFVAAPAHPLAEKYGFTFFNCEFLCGGAEEKSVFLARPWRDFGKCNFLNCRAESHISPALFDKWNDTERDKTARFCYFNLNCDFTPAPVAWSKPLTKLQADDIIAHCESKFK